MSHFGKGVYVVRPTKFALNEETAKDDHFMKVAEGMTDDQLAKKAM